MENDNLLVEREFDIPSGGSIYKVKAIATFGRGGINLTPLPEVYGYYCVSFFINWESATIWQPDKNRYSRKQAKQAAESAFDSGFIRAHAEKEISTWAFLYLNEPV